MRTPSIRSGSTDHLTVYLWRDRISSLGQAPRAIAQSWCSSPSERLATIVSRLLIWDAMHFVMLARVGWLLASLGVFGLLASRRRWWPWLALTIAILVPALVSTGDWDAALAGFLAIGVAVSGALAIGRRWWPTYLLIASAVLLVLVLAADAWVAFGLLFDALAIGGLVGILLRPSLRRSSPPVSGGVRP